MCNNTAANRLFPEIMGREILIWRIKNSKGLGKEREYLGEHLYDESMP